MLYALLRYFGAYIWDGMAAVAIIAVALGTDEITSGLYQTTLLDLLWQIPKPFAIFRASLD
jgi:hypothetical protein